MNVFIFLKKGASIFKGNLISSELIPCKKKKRGESLQASEKEMDMLCFVLYIDESILSLVCSLGVIILVGLIYYL